MMNKMSSQRQSTEEKNLRQGQRRIREVSEALNIRQDEVIRPAEMYFKEIVVDNLLPRRSLDAKVAISLLFSCRQIGRSVKADALAKYVNAEVSEISQCYKDLKKNSPKFQGVQTRFMPVDKLKEVFLKIRVEPDVKKAALSIAENFVKHGVQEGKRPATIGGAAWLIAQVYY